MKFKPGDLVMVVGPTACCGSTKRIGQVHVVGLLTHNKTRCLHCNCVQPTEVQLNTVINSATGQRFATTAARLKKIDPPAEGETTEAYKQVKEKA